MVYVGFITVGRIYPVTSNMSGVTVLWRVIIDACSLEFGAVYTCYSMSARLNNRSIHLVLRIEF